MIAENDYREYYSLTLYERQCLPATNFWRVKSGQPPIAIPPGEILPCIMGSGSAQEIKPEPVQIPSSSFSQEKQVCDATKKPVACKKLAFSMSDHLSRL